MNENSSDPESPPPLPEETWSVLYDLAARVRALEPWSWMQESDVFLVNDPDSGEPLMVSVMGALGEHHAVAVYPGAGSIQGIVEVMHGPQEMNDRSFDILMSLHQLQVQFGLKSDMLPNEKPVAKSLGIQARGRYAWPVFRSMSPGWSPWTPAPWQARQLIIALEQLLGVAPRCQQDRSLLEPGPLGNNHLIRERSPDGAGPTAWRDRRGPLPVLDDRVKPVNPPAELTEAVRQLHQNALTLEVDVFPTLTRIGKRGERPTLPFMMLVVESARGFVEGFELLRVHEQVEELRPMASEVLLGILQRTQYRPMRVRTRTPWVMESLHETCKRLDIRLEQVGHLPALTDARSSFEDFSRR
jgi:hypothetical protein